MANTKFTPGPWKAARDEFGQMIVECPQNKLITLLLPDDNENYADDAHLIAAAPELYQALEKAVNNYGKPGGPWNVPSEPGTWLAMAQAALQKARGEKTNEYD